MGLLKRFFTDYYSRAGGRDLLARIGIFKHSRFAHQLDPSLVRSSWISIILQKLVALFVQDPELQWQIADRWLAGILRRGALRENCHILTYEPWAVPKPPEGFAGGRKQVLFHFHPHVDREDEIYAEDHRRFAKFYGQAKVTESRWRKRTANAWRQADMVLCASSFTRESLLAAGMRAELCRVIPYGVKPPPTEDIAARQGSLKILFVGRNPLRKGLHHLLLAWRQAVKKEGDRLTVVCAARDWAVRELGADQRGVEWRESVSGEELSRLYREADALVVPSLCEGFGHVYLEAMGHGCAAVGTGHSALPDLGGEKEGVFMVPAGEVETLAGLISRASAEPGIFRSRAEAARRRAAEFTWEKFREGVKAAVREVAGD
jgi:glycosyltransferase involved in cell wall biosynthesis